jgi:hypothetical protein
VRQELPSHQRRDFRISIIRLTSHRFRQRNRNSPNQFKGNRLSIFEAEIALFVSKSDQFLDEGASVPDRVIDTQILLTLRRSELHSIPDY